MIEDVDDLEQRLSEASVSTDNLGMANLLNEASVCIARLRMAVYAAARQFRHYEKLHAEKAESFRLHGTGSVDDTLAKADSNRRLAELMEAQIEVGGR